MTNAKYLLFLLLATGAAAAEEWGAYAIVPASAPALVLEAPFSPASTELTPGTAVTIAKPAGAAANQRWMIVERGENLFAIKPLADPELALAAAEGGTKNGTPLVLESDAGKPWQLWTITKHENGHYSIAPKHAPTQGIDDLGGKQEPGSKIDLWQNSGNDQHLEWLIKPLAGTGAAVLTKVGKDEKYEPPVIKPEEIRPGTIKQFKFTESKIFPGTVRDVTVFIPAQYDGSKPTCVYVKTDGYNPREKELMETMIATKEMPVTIGVFVRPGELPAPMKGTLGRRNRDLEYDGVNNGNVRFLVEELLPYVANEFKLNLSTDGNDRCMSGGSSGGIAAFTAAWHRPDAFSRVYAASGSWVAFRGGNEFPTMVRKFEAKPIRAFLTTATHDMENCAGDWFLMDQEMEKALKFSGYDYQFRIIDGRHVAGYLENYREAMAYLWKGWPERVKAGPSAPRAQDVLLPGESWQLLEKGFEGACAPACNAMGEVYFAEPAKSKIHRIELDGTVRELIPQAGHANGLSVGPDGTLFAVSGETGQVVAYDAQCVGRPILQGLHGHSILAMPGGNLYVTAPGEQPGTPDQVWLMKDGDKMLVDTGLKHATGLAYRPDQWLLTVVDGASKWGYSYQSGEDGQLTNKERFFSLHVADWDDDAGAESVCYALEGQMFVATRSGVQICADDGPTQVILPIPGGGRVTGVCLGGPDLDTLFAFSGDKIWKRKVKTHALGAFSPWTKVNGTKL